MGEHGATMTHLCLELLELFFLLLAVLLDLFLCLASCVLYSLGTVYYGQSHAW